MALALLCMAMFVLLTTASMRALRDEARHPTGAASTSGATPRRWECSNDRLPDVPAMLISE